MRANAVSRALSAPRVTTLNISSLMVLDSILSIRFIEYLPEVHLKIRVASNPKYISVLMLARTGSMS